MSALYTHDGGTRATHESDDQIRVMTPRPRSLWLVPESYARSYKTAREPLSTHAREVSQCDVSTFGIIGRISGVHAAASQVSCPCLARTIMSGSTGTLLCEKFALS